MRKLNAAILVAGAAAFAGPAMAADFPEYPPVIEIPDVDYGYEGSFYLRGSAALGWSWAGDVDHPSQTPSVFEIDEAGFGYSLGAGVGYETGTGFRADLTIDHLRNEDLTVTVPATSTLFPGAHRLSLRSTVVLANAYYDFGMGGGEYGAGGGMFGYVGAGVGAAFNNFITSVDGGPADTRDSNVSLAAAGMVGAGYDFGSVVADVGYRGLYINSIENDRATAPYTINDAWIHEVRSTVRYRF